MTDELVRQRPTDALEEHRVVRMLEHASVALPLDVLEVLLRRSPRRVSLTHVAKPAGEFRETLATARVAEPLDG